LTCLLKLAAAMLELKSINLSECVVLAGCKVICDQYVI